jgi:hypothetical protein
MLSYINMGRKKPTKAITHSRQLKGRKMSKMIKNNGKQIILDMVINAETHNQKAASKIRPNTFSLL